ncbi:MAG: hypothetical protein AB7J13_11330, partial [Pyrinomonadaceae bacterium]
MPQEEQRTESDQGESNGQKIWQIVYTSGFIPLLVFGGMLVVGIIILAILVPDQSVRATILAAGIPSVLTLIVVVIQAAVNKQMAEIMARQEAEMTLQREVAEKQWKAMQDALADTKILIEQNNAIVTSSQIQADMAERAVRQSETAITGSERAYLTVRKIRLACPLETND